MSNDIEDLVRATLAARAPATVPPPDWAELRSRARRRTAAGLATTVAGAAAVGTVAVMIPWSGPAQEVIPAAGGPGQTTASAAVPTPTPSATELPAVALDAAVVDAARTYERADHTEWSTGQASRETVEKALGTLMASPQVTDDSAQPQVVWSSAGHVEDAAQGPQVMVAVEQSDGWVLGFWDERRPYGTWIRGMSFGAMTPGPIEHRLVGIAIPDGTYENIGGTLFVVVPPADTTKIVDVVTQAQVDAGWPEPLGTEMSLGAGFQGIISEGPKTYRAYAVDGTIIDEQTYVE